RHEAERRAALAALPVMPPDHPACAVVESTDALGLVVEEPEARRELHALGRAGYCRGHLHHRARRQRSEAWRMHTPAGFCLTRVVSSLIISLTCAPHFHLHFHQDPETPQNRLRGPHRIASEPRHRMSRPACCVGLISPRALRRSRVFDETPRRLAIWRVVSISPCAPGAASAASFTNAKMASRYGDQAVSSPL